MESSTLDWNLSKSAYTPLGWLPLHTKFKLKKKSRTKFHISLKNKLAKNISCFMNE